MNFPHITLTKTIALRVQYLKDQGKTDFFTGRP
jgi:hypothetical protein